jgi:hypothetical protein
MPSSSSVARMPAKMVASASALKPRSPGSSIQASPSRARIASAISTM